MESVQEMCSRVAFRDPLDSVIAAYPLQCRAAILTRWGLALLFSFQISWMVSWLALHFTKISNVSHQSIFFRKLEERVGENDLSGKMEYFSYEDSAQKYLLTTTCKRVWGHLAILTVDGKHLNSLDFCPPRFLWHVHMLLAKTLTREIALRSWDTGFFYYYYYC